MFRIDCTRELYCQHEKLVCSRAWSWHRLTGVPVEELISEARLIFFKSLRKWDKKKSKLSYWIYITVNSGLQKFCYRYHDLSAGAEEADFGHLIAPSAPEDSVREKMLTLPLRYREQLKKILEDNRNISKGELTKRLRAEGWRWREIRAFFERMKKF